MEKQRKRKVVLVIVLLLIIAGISVAYAVMSQALNIQGTGTVAPAAWDIEFANLVAHPTGTADEVTAPTINNSYHTISNFDVTLKKPGDSVVYTFDVTNKGSLDAYLDTLSMVAPTFVGQATDPTDAAADEALVESNLVYTLTYTTGGATVVAGSTVTLAAGDTINMTLTISYPDTLSELPTDDVAITGMDITLTYLQL